MNVEVLGTDEFQARFLDLSVEEQAAVVNVVRRLEIAGVALGRPHTGYLEGTKEPLRELRPKQGRSPLYRTPRLSGRRAPRRPARSGAPPLRGSAPRSPRRSARGWREGVQPSSLPRASPPRVGPGLCPHAPGLALADRTLGTRRAPSEAALAAPSGHHGFWYAGGAQHTIRKSHGEAQIAYGTTPFGAPVARPERGTESWFSPAAVAERLKVSRATVYALIKSGALHYRRVGLQIRIPEQALDVFLRG